MCLYCDLSKYTYLVNTHILSKSSVLPAFWDSILSSTLAVLQIWVSNLLQEESLRVNAN